MKVTGAQVGKAYKDTVDDREFELGAEYEDESGRVFAFLRYQNLSGGNSVAGLWAVGCDTAYNYYDVTCDSNHADGNDNDPRGQCQAVLEDGECGFFQKNGKSRQVTTTDGNVNQDVPLQVSGAARGILIPATAGTAQVGVSRASDGAGTSLAAGYVAIGLPKK
ncbi:MAG: hypothetical protein ACW99G_01620 [Candidatus Thorarchaeota archaeon]|jgi:hypothetical protein